MSLDNANFIAELSIVDPPGSDPLSEGDDHIRTVKRATQQSFPLIAAAVNISDSQMNQMAIKNEANIFTVPGQSFLDNNIIRRSAIDTFPRWRWVDEGDLVQWEAYMAAGPDNDFLIQRRTDGVFQDVPIRINWTTGVVNFEHTPTIDGAPIWIAGEIRQFVAGATPGTNWFLADGTNGTVDLRDRVLLGAGASAAGTLLNPNLVGTAAAGVTGSTVLTEAQMPSHIHAHGQTQGTVNGASDSTNIEDQSVGTVADDPTRPFHVFTEPTGGDQGHTHTSPAQAVTENGTSRDTVRPLSAVVEYYQYVP